MKQQQDTTKLKATGAVNISAQNKDTLAKIKQDTIVNAQDTSLKDIPVNKTTVSEITNKADFTLRPFLPVQNTDSVCSKSLFYNILQYYSSDTLFLNTEISGQTFPLSYIKASEKFREEIDARFSIKKKEGIRKEKNNLKADWMLPVILVATLLYIIIRKVPGNYFKSIIDFVSLRGINESLSRETARIFRIQSTLINFSSYINISLFGCIALNYFNISIPGISSFELWLLALGVVVLSVTIRQIISRLTGLISESTEIFSQYSITVLNFYRAAGLICFCLLITFLYTQFPSGGILIRAGILITAILYILRIIRLFLIFVNRRASILYLFLYLCALEILPFIVIIKYITGL